MRKTSAAIVLVLAAVASIRACVNPMDSPDKDGGTTDAEDVKVALATAASEGARFVFFPPLVGNRDIHEGFDPSFSPAVRIDEIGGDSASDFPLEFTMASGDPSERVQIVPDEEHYIVN